MIVGLTGATGFIGAATLRALAHAGHRAVPIVRQPSGLEGELVAGDLGETSEPLPPVPPLDVLLHVAARAHRAGEPADAALAAFRRANVGGAERAIALARAGGARRFVLVSSIKANGEQTSPGRPFTEADPLDPQDPYGRSKAEAEALVRRRCEEAGLEWVIVRPPLVYGPGAKGNFPLLVRLATSGVPLPFGLVDNRRSLIAVENLADFLVRACEHPAAARRVLLPSDGSDLSTPALIRLIAGGAGRRARLLPVPPRWLMAAARLAGRKEIADRLLGSLQLDGAAAARAIGWTPVLGQHAAIATAVRAARRAPARRTSPRT